MSAAIRESAAQERAGLAGLRTGPIVRAAPWIFAVLCLGVAWLIVREAVAGQLEDHRPTYALLVQPGDVEALNAAAERLLPAAPRDAVTLARRSLSTRPLNPGAFAVLAQAASAQGDGEAALKLYAATGRWTGRDPASEAWLYDGRVRQGDFPGAMDAADRLLRVLPAGENALFPSLIAMARDRTARPALVAKLTEAPPWRTAFLWALSRTAPDPLVAVDVMSGMSALGAPPSVEEVTPVLARLVDAKRYLEAFLAWRQFAPETPAALASVRDGDFQGLQAAAPFVWSLSPSQGAAADISPAPASQTARDQSLHVTYDGFSAASTVVSQLLVLGPGDYRFSDRAYSAAAAADTRLSWTLTCADTGQSLLNTSPASGLDTGWNAQSAFATVPARGCQGQWLRLVTAPGGRRSLVRSRGDVANPLGRDAAQPFFTTGENKTSRRRVAGFVQEPLTFEVV